MDWFWKRPLKFDRIDAVGLDIGSSQVKLVQLRKDNNGYAVSAAGIVDAAPGRGSNNLGEADNSRAIRECVESSGATAEMAVCGVSGPEVAVRCFKFPPLPSAEIEGAVLLEAAQVCPFNVEDSAVDYQLIPDGDDSICGVLVAATRKLVRRKSQLVKGAYLKCALMDVDGLALLNCFNSINPGERKQSRFVRTTAILNVGGSYTTLAIMGANGLPFIRDMANAGNHIVERIAHDNSMSKEAVSATLSGDSTSAQSELQDSLAEACKKLIVDVNETLRYYTAKEKGTIVEEIFVCGGFALVKGFVDLLNEGLAARAVLWNPFEKIRYEAGHLWDDILGTRGPSMAVAAGLAMRSI